MNDRKMRRKLRAYAMATSDDIGVTDGDLVVDGKVVRGWIGTVYGCMVGTSRYGRRFATKDEARRNAEIFVEECAEIVSDWNARGIHQADDFLGQLKDPPKGKA